MAESKIKYKKLERLGTIKQEDFLYTLNYKKNKKTHFQKFMENWNGNQE